MSQEIKALLEKIQQEGVKVAEDKARAIEDEAKSKAEEILKAATQEATRLVNAAKEKIAKMEAASEATLQQAGRNMLLTLRKEINALLDKLLAVSAREALRPAELEKLIHTLIKESARQEKQGIVITLSQEDLHLLEKGVLAELKEEAQKGITLKAAGDIAAGFVISFDGGKSHFDFTDKALAEYLGQYLKPKLAEILKG